MLLILVHGAWHDSSSWSALEDAWTDPQIQTASLDLPSVSGTGNLSLDAHAVVEFANTIDDDIILLGHSYGGAVVTEAASRVDRLQGVIYLAAIRPHVGEPVSNATPQLSGKSRLDDAVQRTGDVLVLRLELAADALYGSTDAPLVSASLSRLHPQPLACFRELLTSEVPEVIRTHYVICALDESIRPDLQSLIAAQCTTSSILNASHFPQLEYPDLTATHLASVIRDRFVISC